MTGLKAHVVHLYPRWVLSRGNGTLIRKSGQPLSLLLHCFYNDLILFKDFKTPTSLSLVRWLVRYSVWLLKKKGSRRSRLGTAPIICKFQAQLHWNQAQLHIRVELETCKLWEPYPRSMPKPYDFWPQIPPSANIPIYDLEINIQLQIKIRHPQS